MVKLSVGEKSTIALLAHGVILKLAAAISIRMVMCISTDDHPIATGLTKVKLASANRRLPIAVIRWIVMEAYVVILISAFRVKNVHLTYI